VTPSVVARASDAADVSEIRANAISSDCHEFFVVVVELTSPTRLFSSRTTLFSSRSS